MRLKSRPSRTTNAGISPDHRAGAGCFPAGYLAASVAPRLKSGTGCLVQRWTRLSPIGSRGDTGSRPDYPGLPGADPRAIPVEVLSRYLIFMVPYIVSMFFLVFFGIWQKKS